VEDQLSTSRSDQLEQVKVFVGGGLKGAFYFNAEIYTYHVLAELADQVLSVNNFNGTSSNIYALPLSLLSGFR
jgi:hypothetical protein